MSVTMPVSPNDYVEFLFTATEKTTVTLSSTDALAVVPPDKFDREIFIPVDLNSIFGDVELTVPVTDPNTDEAHNPQATIGNFQSDHWRNVYLTKLLVADTALANDTALADRPATASHGNYNQTELDSSVKKEVTDAVSILFTNQPAAYVRSLSTVSLKDEALKDWINSTKHLNGSIDTADLEETFGKKIFTEQQFTEIHDKLRAAKKFQRMPDGPNEVPTTAKLALLEGECIGIPIILRENDSNLQNINFYFCQKTLP